MLKNNRNMILKRRGGGLEQDPVHKHLWYIMLNFLLTNYYFIYTIIKDDNFSQGTSILTINFLEHAIHAL